EFLTPNEYPKINPHVFDVKMIDVIDVPKGKIGLVYAKKGRFNANSFPPKVVPCKNYSSASLFIDNGNLSVRNNGLIFQLNFEEFCINSMLSRS
ncbi:MAG: hypothetical protein AAFN93_22665, partial [Bacteroidota bacterium]